MRLDRQRRVATNRRRPAQGSACLRRGVPPVAWAVRAYHAAATRTLTRDDKLLIAAVTERMRAFPKSIDLGPVREQTERDRARPTGRALERPIPQRPHVAVEVAQPVERHQRAPLA